MTNFLLQSALASKIEKLGLGWVKLQKIALYGASRSAQATITLAGESDPLEVTVHYKIESDHVHITEVMTSRAWMNAAVQTFGMPKLKPIPLPKGLAGILATFVLT